MIIVMLPTRRLHSTRYTDNAIITMLAPSD